MNLALSAAFTFCRKSGFLSTIGRLVWGMSA
uniref:Uncharacterized protein n=1 Tax=Anguilla anguilla TaxID=7936 RepID=A0A0E9VD73_ANGAN